MITCQMTANCNAVVTYIDEKGFVYCDPHGKTRKHTARCRKLTAKEAKQLKAGQPLQSYERTKQ